MERGGGGGGGGAEKKHIVSLRFVIGTTITDYWDVI